MLDISGIMMVVLLVAVLIFGFVMDGYAVFLRVAGAAGLAEILAMANLVQYIARISNVLVIFILSFAFETGWLALDVSFIFLAASAFGIIFVLLLIASRRFCDLTTFFLRPLLYFSFREKSAQYVWRKLGFVRVGSLKLLAISTLTNSLIVLAMFIPFGIASHFPEMRMTSVYVGQLVNFFATLLVFAIQDPVSMRLVDGGVLDEVGAALLYGRVLSYFVASLVFVLMLLL